LTKVKLVFTCVVLNLFILVCRETDTDFMELGIYP